jgi:spore coat protein U-like protein
MKRSSRNLTILAFAVLSCWQQAQAAVACSVSATGVAFGAYILSSPTPADSTGTVSFTCTVTPPPPSDFVSYTIALSAGSSGNYANRHMLSGANQLNYNLYLNSARTLVWNNSTNVASGSFTLGPSGDTRTQTATFTIHGRIPAAQDVPTGSYSDSIVVTVTF